MSASDFFRIAHGAAGREDAVTIALQGEWSLAHYEELARAAIPDAHGRTRVVIDGSGLRRLDTAGASLLLRLCKGRECELLRFTPDHEKLLSLVRERLAGAGQERGAASPTALERLGRSAAVFVEEFIDSLSFLGRTVAALAEIITKPVLLRFKELVVQLEMVFWNAIPIVMLVSGLIGIVVAYLFASQSEKFGASIFVVDAVSIAMCRELAPLLVAVIVAGRSGSAFTAQIGTMKLNEEVDALRAMGLSVFHVVVLPRVVALMIAMPLLVFVADVAGIAGGAFISKTYVGLTYVTFLDRLQSVLPIKQVVIGLVKGPLFAAVIAMIGCRLGLKVEGNARSVGIFTTASVVHSIVLVIILNAALAVVLVELGI